MRLVNPQDNHLKLATLVMYRATEYEGNYEPIMASDVPDWVKNDPKVVKRLMDGYIAHNEDEGGYWYRAEKPEIKKGLIIN